MRNTGTLRKYNRFRLRVYQERVGEIADRQADMKEGGRGPWPPSVMHVAYASAATRDMKSRLCHRQGLVTNIIGNNYWLLIRCRYSQELISIYWLSLLLHVIFQQKLLKIIGSRYTIWLNTICHTNFPSYKYYWHRYVHRRVWYHYNSFRCNISRKIILLLPVIPFIVWNIFLWNQQVLCI